MDNKPVMTSGRAVATRNRILDGAIASFASFGQAATIEQILQTADVGRTTFYRHFSNLEDVLSQAVVRDLDVLLANVTKEQSPMMKDGVKMRQFLKSFLVPSLIEPGSGLES
jgi:AcrR family transcriptional regulator